MLGLFSLSAFRPDGRLNQLEVDSCSVVTMGKVSWASQQKTRTSVLHLMGVDTSRLNAFSLALRSLDSRCGVSKDGALRVQTSIARGLFAENIARDRNWFEGFYQLMQSGKLAQALRYERRGLTEMIERMTWSAESDRLFVESIHTAIRNRYGALAARAKQKGEAARFDREFERMRSSLARAKNGQSLRAEIADLFARGGINKNLQEHWPAVLQLFSGPDWQKARDLALLALASYSGAGANEAAIQPTGEEEEEQ
jgi:CRISPR-associated protein Cas8a1/Csx13